MIDSNYDISTICDENSVIEYVENMKKHINVETSDDFELFKLFSWIISKSFIVVDVVKLLLLLVIFS